MKSIIINVKRKSEWSKATSLAMVAVITLGVMAQDSLETIPAGVTNETTLSAMAANPVAEYAMGDAT